MPLIRSSLAAFLSADTRRCNGTLLVLSLLSALVSTSVEVACSGESVTFIDISTTRIDPRSMVIRCFPRELADREAMMRMRKRSSGAPKTTNRAARYAKNEIKNCFIGAKEVKRPFILETEREKTMDLRQRQAG